MKYKVLFYGFRHSHVYDVHQKINNCDVFEIAGYLEEDDPSRCDAQDKLGVTFSTESYESWLSSDIDIVVIGKAYGDRGDAVIRALEAGKHIIADKPICTDLKQLEKISELCEQKNLQLQCMLDLRYLPQTLMAKKLLSDGVMGKIRNVSFQGQHCLNYGKRPGWYFESGMHGGTINDLAIHGVDLVRMITGSEFACIDAARTWNSYAKEEPNFNDCAVFMARLENGASVMADVSYSAPSQVFTMPTYWEFRFWCDEGMLTFHYTDPYVMLFKNGDPEPIVVNCDAAKEDYVSELLQQLSTGDRKATHNVLMSTKTALELQQYADERGLH